MCTFITIYFPVDYQRHEFISLAFDILSNLAYVASLANIARASQDGDFDLIQTNMDTDNSKFMTEAIRLSVENVEQGKGGPFGAVIVKNGVIIARGANSVTSTNDPTAHAEVVAIRNACSALGTFQLDGCEIYTSCEPCPMCLGAIYWARPDKMYYANSKEDAAAIDFDDQFIYEEIAKPISERKLFTQQIMREEGLEAFNKWSTSLKKIEY